MNTLKLLQKQPSYMSSCRILIKLTEKCQEILRVSYELILSTVQFVTALLFFNFFLIFKEVKK